MCIADAIETDPAHACSRGTSQLAQGGRQAQAAARERCAPPVKTQWGKAGSVEQALALNSDDRWLGRHADKDSGDLGRLGGVGWRWVHLSVHHVTPGGQTGKVKITSIASCTASVRSSSKFPQ